MKQINLPQTSDFSDAVKLFHSHFDCSTRHSDLNFLKSIVLHFSSLPYENLSKIVKHHDVEDSAEKIRLPNEVMNGHAEFGLGGTCFALTFFLQSILEYNGFTCYPVMADMRYGPNTHSALVVLLRGKKLLVDPGYLLNNPLELQEQGVRVFQTDVQGVELRYLAEGRIYELYTFNQEGSKWRYKFKDRPVANEDFIALWKSSFSWNGMRGLVLTKNEKDRMIYVHKTFMRETSWQGKKNFNIKQNYHQRIQEAFGIDPEFTERALAALESNLERDRKLGLWVPKHLKNQAE